MLELRLEDYKLIREGRLPDEMKMLLANGHSLANYQPKAGGGYNIGGQSQNTGFGILGNNTQAQSGGLFQASSFGNNKPASSASGIFGNSQTPNNFFNPNPAANNVTPTTPLFGNNAYQTQPQPNPTTSIFGGAGANNFNAAPKTNIFGNLNTPTTGGILGNASGGLNPQGTTGGLFNSMQPGINASVIQQSPFSQNFMQKPGDNTTQSTGMFANLSSNSVQPQGGLFPSTQTAYGQPQQQAPLYQNNPNFGNANNYMPQQNQGMMQQGNNMFVGTTGLNIQPNNMAMPTGQPLGGYNQYPIDQNYNPNLSLFGSSQLFTNSPKENNWLYHDWNREYENFYGNSYQDNDDLGFFPYNPYKKKASMNRNSNLIKNLTISRKHETDKYTTEKFDFNKNNPAFEKKVSQEEKKPKEFIDKEPHLTGYQQEKQMSQKKNPRDEEKSGFAADKQRIQGKLYCY